MSRYVFAIEQGLGHVVHGANIERAAELRDDIDATFLKVFADARSDGPRLPLVKNWSAQASWATRALVRKRVAAGDVDAIFVHTQVAALMLGRIMRRVPTVISLDATPIDIDAMGAAYNHQRNSEPVERVKFQMTRRALTGARAIVTMSPWAAASVVEHYGVPADRVHPVFPGTDVRTFRPRDPAPTSGPVRLLFVGGDFERKGGPDLVRAAATVGECVELDIVTSTPGVSLPDSLRGRVLAGVGANSSTMAELYREADIFVLPTRGDCTPFVVAEALASGLPIIASSIGAIPDMVPEGEHGLLVPPGNPRRLAEALQHLVARPDLRRSMGARNRALAIAKHDCLGNCQRIFRVMDQVAHPATRTGARVPDRAA